MSLTDVPYEREADCNILSKSLQCQDTFDELSYYVRSTGDAWIGKRFAAYRTAAFRFFHHAFYLLWS